MLDDSKKNVNNPAACIALLFFRIGACLGLFFNISWLTEGTDTILQPQKYK
jgi:hypothetical protein